MAKAIQTRPGMSCRMTPNFTTLPTPNCNMSGKAMDAAAGDNDDAANSDDDAAGEEDAASNTKGMGCNCV